MSDVWKLNNDKYLFLINGYLKMCSIEFKLYIPSEISCVIYQIYPKKDEWDLQTIDNKISVDSERNTVTMIANVPTGQWYNAYGKYRIIPRHYVVRSNLLMIRDKYKIIHSWQIKLEKIDKYRIVNCGIAVECNLCSIPGGHAFNYNDKGYGIYLCMRTLFGIKKHGKGCDFVLDFEQGDIMEIILLFIDAEYDKCCIGFAKNGGEIEIAFDEVDIDKTYLVCVALHRMKDCVQLIG